MARRPRIPATLRERITRIDGHRCAYCRSPLVVGIPMVIEHVVPLIAGGNSAVDNLCLACYRCNEFKGPRRDATDPQEGHVVSLFHPRQQRWSDHFAWAPGGITLVGLTPTGRATIDLLRLNGEWITEARGLWILIGVQPPLESFE
jgi:5-methylcytosine-specific restriction endonuclease McrA